MSVNANKKPMNANKLAARRSLNSALARADAHTVKSEEYDELPALTAEMLGRAIICARLKVAEALAQGLRHEKRIIYGIEVQRSSGNVYADLGLPDAE